MRGDRCFGTRLEQGDMPLVTPLGRVGGVGSFTRIKYVKAFAPLCFGTI
jgi:hypothetical protein